MGLDLEDDLIWHWTVIALRYQVRDILKQRLLAA